MITNEHAQVLDEQDRVIDGLYATGNITATVMGRTYPGAGGEHRQHDGVRLRRARAHAAGRKFAARVTLLARVSLSVAVDEIPWLQA